MEYPYYIDESTIIFNCKFNEPLGKYISIFKNVKQIIFSNYSDYEIYIQTKNIYNSKYNDKYKCSNFNYPIFNSLNNLIQLEQLIFGFSFNYSLSNSLNNLTQLKELTFGYSFNCPLSNSLDNLVELEQISLGLSEPHKNFLKPKKFYKRLYIQPTIGYSWKYSNIKLKCQ